MAWHVAALHRQEKLPDLSDLLGKDDEPKEQTPAEQVIAMDQLFLAWGGDPAALKAARAERGD